MNIKEFYSEFNKITSEHTDSDETKSKLTELMESFEGSKDSLDIDIDQIVSDLESQKESANSVKKVDIDEEQEDDSYYYDESYESSY